MIELKITDAYKLSSLELKSIISYLQSFLDSNIATSNPDCELKIFNQKSEQLPTELYREKAPITEIDVTTSLEIPSHSHEVIGGCLTAGSYVSADVIGRGASAGNYIAADESLWPRKNAQGIDVDITGIPWDRRIHSSSKILTKDNRWKRVRGVVEQTANDLEEKLRSDMQTASKKSNIPAPPPTIPAPPEPVLSFVSVMKKITHHLHVTKKLTQTTVLDIIRSVGLNDMTSLQQRPDLLPEVDSQLETILSI